jgi:hypothetical protein
MLTIGHVPIKDTVYLMHPADGGELREDIISESETARWFTRGEIADADDVAPHMKELLVMLLADGNHDHRLKCWKPESDFENYLLQQVQGPEVQT